MGDPDHHVTQRPAVDADMASFEAGRIGQICAGGDDSVLHIYGIGTSTASAPVKRLPTQRKVSVTRLCPSRWDPMPEDSYVIRNRPGVDVGARIVVQHGCCGGVLLF